MLRFEAYESQVLQNSECCPKLPSSQEVSQPPSQPLSRQIRPSQNRNMSQTSRSLTDVALCVLEGPDHAVNDQFLVLWGDLEERPEAVCVDRLKEPEELQPVFREVLTPHDIP